MCTAGIWFSLCKWSADLQGSGALTVHPHCDGCNFSNCRPLTSELNISLHLTSVALPTILKGYSGKSAF